MAAPATRSPHALAQELPALVVSDVYARLLFATAETPTRSPKAAKAASRLRIALPRPIVRSRSGRSTAASRPNSPATPFTALPDDTAAAAPSAQPKSSQNGTARPPDAFDWAVAQALRPDARPLVSLAAPLWVRAPPLPANRPPPEAAAVANGNSARRDKLPPRARVARKRHTGQIRRGTTATLVLGATKEEEAYVNRVGTLANMVFALAKPPVIGVIGRAALKARAADVSRCTAITVLPGHLAYMDAHLGKLELQPTIQKICNVCCFMSWLEEIDLSVCTGLHTIGDMFACASPRLRSLRLPASLTAIGDSFAARVPVLEALDLSGCTRLTAIGGSFLEEAAALRTLTLAPALRVIGEFFCTRSGVAALDLSGCGALGEVPPYFGANAEALERVALPASITRIGPGFAAGATSLAAVDLSRCAALETIDDAFAQGATRLAHIALPAGVRSVGSEFCAASGVAVVDLSQCASLGSVGDGFAASSCVSRVSRPRVRLPQRLPAKVQAQVTAALVHCAVCCARIDDAPAPTHSAVAAVSDVESTSTATTAVSTASATPTVMGAHHTAVTD